MLIEIPDVLRGEQLERIQRTLANAAWCKGLLKDISVNDALGGEVVAAVQAIPKFLSSALPLKVFPPQFYQNITRERPPTMANESIRSIPGTLDRVRADLSAALFLTAPGEYEGGEFVVESYSSQSVKLPAGHLLLFPSSGRITVRAVTKGAGYTCVFWVQSLIRNDTQRTILFDMDSAIQQLTTENPDHPSTLRLAGVYHNILRYWAQT